MLGASGRYFALALTNNFYLLLASQTLIACCQPFLCNGVSKLASAWFGDSERGLATALGSLTTPIGCILGLVMGPLFVSELKQGGDISSAQN